MRAAHDVYTPENIRELLEEYANIAKEREKELREGRSVTILESKSDNTDFEMRPEAAQIDLTGLFLSRKKSQDDVNKSTPEFGKGPEYGSFGKKCHKVKEERKRDNEQVPIANRKSSSMLIQPAPAYNYSVPKPQEQIIILKKIEEETRTGDSSNLKQTVEKKSVKNGNSNHGKTDGDKVRSRRNSRNVEEDKKAVVSKAHRSSSRSSEQHSFKSPAKKSGTVQEDDRKSNHSSRSSSQKRDTHHADAKKVAVGSEEKKAEQIDKPEIKKTQKEKRKSAKQNTFMRSFTKQQLAKHSKIDDFWIAYDGLVFDITKWVTSHPGGLKVIQKYAGTDCTKVFQKEHPWVNITKLVGDKQIGTLNG